ncbi:hypothetical protein [Leptospira selangorensis]|uniref:hypothetical protein n=1 Tax=Leptospira selangorensis TaxID=2484982 RepID=UPI00143854A7|nr:hypothetical protein [Leptospira selangorensis]
MKIGLNELMMDSFDCLGFLFQSESFGTIDPNCQALSGKGRGDSILILFLFTYSIQRDQSFSN